MTKIFLFLISLFWILHMPIMARETCSRNAFINYQKVLVDGNTNKRGEGLRFYLEKDPISLKLLNEYQEKSKQSYLNVGASTFGSLLILTGLLKSSDSDTQNRSSYLYGGSLIIALSYLVAKTVEYENERILQRAIDQYNKRNRPRIYFSPFKKDNTISIGVGITQEF